jgi:hypothetical protein
MATDPDETYMRLGLCFLVHGLTGWTIQDEQGVTVPHDEDTLRSGRIDWETVLSPIAERASTLYTDSVINPLVKGRKAPLQPGQTAASTSQTNGSSSQNPEPSEPSTTPITPRSRPTGSPIGIASSI